MRRHLERRVPVLRPDGGGGVVRGWEARGAFWAGIRASSASLRVTELGADPELRVRITVRTVPVGHPDRPAQGDRLVETGRVYEVEAVHEADAAGRYLTCWAREIVGEGGT